MIKHGLIGETPLDPILYDTTGQTIHEVTDLIEPFDPSLPDGKNGSLVWQRDLSQEQMTLNQSGLSAVRAVLRAKTDRGN